MIQPSYVQYYIHRAVIGKQLVLTLQFTNDALSGMTPSPVAIPTSITEKTYDIMIKILGLGRNRPVSSVSSVLIQRGIIKNNKINYLL